MQNSLKHPETPRNTIANYSSFLQRKFYLPIIVNADFVVEL